MWQCELGMKLFSKKASCISSRLSTLYILYPFINAYYSNCVSFVYLKNTFFKALCFSPLILTHSP